MSYLYGRKFHGPITNLVLKLRREIHPIPYEEIDWNKQHHNCCKNPNGDEFKHHLARVPDYIWLAEDGMKMQSFGSQSPISGGFAIWEPPVPKPYLEALNPSEIFANIVVEKEHAECTASIIQALLAFKRLHPGHYKKEIEVAVAKAARFLEEKQKA
ncbi:hypothetical protein RJ640_007421 [Escallonia rubra]|uniref:Uncharacterized protein n=1 Tax=Escallonia rubra TaxID=112253 RepID=A0AA88RFC6_9ASTE|nr:hypothetical protein RJ640_007421 [Escallonia rubra]